MPHELMGMEYLRHKLHLKQDRVRTRYAYYEMKHLAEDLRISTPPRLLWMNSTLGWCAKACDSLADRLVFREFRNDYFNINEIYNLNNRDTLFDNAILSAVITSCSFIYIAPAEAPETDPTPRLYVIDGAHATGEIDQTTGLLHEGYAILEQDKDGKPTVEAYFIPGYTYVYRRGETEPTVYSHKVQQCTLVPIINRPDAKRPFGHSGITRACMSIVDAAMRSMKRAEISAEYYSFPQKYVLGLSEGTDFDNARAYMSSFLSFTADEDGNKPTVGQFQSASMAPHTEQMRMWANMFAGETGLTLDDLGFPTANPSSSDAIKAAHESLRLRARKAQRTMGTGFMNAGYIAACLRDDMDYKRSQFYLTTPVWEPVFEPDISSLSLIGDALIKMQQAYPNYFGELSIYDLTGIKPESVAEGMTMERIDEEANGGAIIDDLLNIGGV